jgi:hypothetical protein
MTVAACRFDSLLATDIPLLTYSYLRQSLKIGGNRATDGTDNGRTTDLVRERSRVQSSLAAPSQAPEIVAKKTKLTFCIFTLH